MNINDIHRIVKSASQTPASKNKKAFKIYVGSYIGNYEGEYQVSDRYNVS
jgi:hypothetical protein